MSQSVPFELPGFAVRRCISTGEYVEIEAEAVSKCARCPQCRTPSASVHSHYRRHVRDLPLSNQAVWLRLSVRRFRCQNVACAQRIFVERLPRIAAAHARRSRQLRTTLTQVGLLLGGEAGSRLARSLRMAASPDTLLRMIRLHPLPACTGPRVLGVDDWAARKGQRYGTILVDLERSVPIDLLPDRAAETLSSWLKSHPGIAFITRDRFPEYAHGSQDGAPQSRQIADRWHLLKNLRETLERLLKRMYPRLRALPALTMPVMQPMWGRPRRLRPWSANEKASQEASRFQRYHLYRTVHDLVARGLSQRRIAGLLNLHRATVRLFAQAQTFPERVPRRARRSILDPYLPYLRRRWQAGGTNASQLHREIRELGYLGSYQQVARWAHSQRIQAVHTAPPAPPLIRTLSTVALPAPRHLAWLLLRSPDRLSDTDAALLTHMRQDARFAQVHTLADQFQRMLRLRLPDELDTWLDQCLSCEWSDLREFALGIVRDIDAVRNALTYPWSNGPVEGHICRLKLLKRQMYGRANFDLLRQRVLAHP